MLKLYHAGVCDDFGRLEAYSTYSSSAPKICRSGYCSARARRTWMNAGDHSPMQVRLLCFRQCRCNDLHAVGERDCGGENMLLPCRYSLFSLSCWPSRRCARRIHIRTGCPSQLCRKQAGPCNCPQEYPVTLVAFAEGQWGSTANGCQAVRFRWVRPRPISGFVVSCPSACWNTRTYQSFQVAGNMAQDSGKATSCCWGAFCFPCRYV